MDLKKFLYILYDSEMKKITSVSGIELMTLKAV